jgi:CheY-like chemotaxis protein
MATPSKHQVLVVDDDPSVRETVALLLMSAGYDVAAAEDDFGALLQLRKMLPDLIISDLNMPHMSGFELLSVVRRRFPEILTVAMSGAYRNSDELRPEVIADAFYAKGEHSTIFLELSRSYFVPLQPAAATITGSYLQLGSLATGMTPKGS